MKIYLFQFDLIQNASHPFLPMGPGEQIDFNLSAAPIPVSQQIVQLLPMEPGEQIDLNLSTAPIPISQQIVQLLPMEPGEQIDSNLSAATSEMDEDLDKLVEDLTAMIALDGKIYSF